MPVSTCGPNLRVVGYSSQQELYYIGFCYNLVQNRHGHTHQPITLTPAFTPAFTPALSFTCRNKVQQRYKGFPGHSGSWDFSLGDFGTEAITRGYIYTLNKYYVFSMFCVPNLVLCFTLLFGNNGQPAARLHIAQITVLSHLLFRSQRIPVFSEGRNTRWALRDLLNS